MVPLEVNAAGRPVIAYRAAARWKQSLMERPEFSSISQLLSRLCKAIEQFESMHWSQILLRRHAEKFDRNVFAFRVLQFLGSVAPASCQEELLAAARVCFPKTFRSESGRDWQSLGKRHGNDFIVSSIERSAAGCAVGHCRKSGCRSDCAGDLAERSSRLACAARCALVMDL